MKVSDKVLALPAFIEAYGYIVQESVQLTLNSPSYVRRHSKFSIDWSYALECTSVIVQDDRAQNQEVSLRVAQSCLMSSETTDDQRAAAAVILDILTNRPALNLAIARRLIPENFRADLPAPYKLGFINRALTYSIPAGGIQKSDRIYVNSFQKSVFDAVSSNQYVSISAPTSAGKSFILKKIVLDALSAHKQANVVYIVPTRALIGQVEREMRTESLKAGQQVLVSSIPSPVGDVEADLGRLYIFTPERLHWFINQPIQTPIDVLVIDEAQKIQDRTRGLLLQRKLEELTESIPEIRIYFASPSVLNPEVLLESLPKRHRATSVNRDYVAVNQNLIHVQQVPRKPKQWTLKLQTKSESTELGTLTLDSSPAPESKILPFIANALGGRDGGSLVYCNFPSAAENCAIQLYELQGPDYKCSEKVLSLVELVKQVVHPQYRLAKTLTRGIAFHYGNMPLIIRKTIEDLFESGDLKFLVCTSTLLEGVNLPAKALFLRNPRLGRSIHMRPVDFWNLAGRVGRLGREFQGNVFCISPEKWDEPPTPRERQPIEPAIRRTEKDLDQVIAFFDSGCPRGVARQHPEFDYAVWYYYDHIMRTGARPQPGQSVALRALLERLTVLSRSISIPSAVVARNPGISPVAMENLLSYFKAYRGPLHDLVPAPASDQFAVEVSYKPIIEAISTHLSGDSVNASYHYAILVVNWMSGQPLSTLIRRNYEYRRRHDAKTSIHSVIRETMEELEQYVRFRFAKYSSCYLDILKYFMSGKSIAEEEIPDLTYWLEFGVSQRTQLSLLELGLSRSTAIQLSNFIVREDMDKEECVRWIEDRNLLDYDLSPLMVAEIKEALAIRDARLGRGQ